MSTDLKTNLKHYTAHSSWGGDNHGTTLSIHWDEATGFMRDPNPEPEQNPGHIRLDMAEASRLIGVLSAFVKTEAQRRQGLLRAQIADLKDAENTVFHEVSELKSTFLDVHNHTVDLIEKLAPKSSS